MGTLHRTAKGLWPRYTEQFMPIAHAVSHAKREWGKPRQSLMGETPKTALPPREATASLLFAQPARSAIGVFE
ncbi:hypothetical protein BJP37_07290 [Moorena bouillonii PNG]|uniref:Uncharacterized protein n=1 Tax=Moorena bouillonii PNG TaxID=568701 RepID=A0A1U7MYU5_9CYAN|nr:hypothetical protein BJP37_07290 [Moorena bouillonii PNG]